jgi:hypothetical protein
MNLMILLGALSDGAMEIVEHTVHNEPETDDEDEGTN